MEKKAFPYYNNIAMEENAVLSPFEREITLIGESNFEKLSGLHVAVFGIGGVGGGVLEALVRAGVGEITVVDADTVNITNLNRQFISFYDNIGISKTDAAEIHALKINPNVIVHKRNVFFSEDTLGCFDFSKFDFVADCIDSVNEKVLLIKTCVESGCEIISSMGTGNKLHPEMLELSDISKTSYCPLARVMRTRLKKEGIERLAVVYSREEAVKNDAHTIGSISFVPPVAGMIMAGYIVRKICEK